MTAFYPPGGGPNIVNFKFISNVFYLFNRTWQQLVDEVTLKNRFLYHLPNPYQSRTFCKLLFTILSKNLNSVMDLSAIASGIPLNLERAKFSISSNIECKWNPLFGKFVTDTNICITSGVKFTCTVSKGFSLSNQTELFVASC